MNIADYLSELLAQHDEVSVPGLGYFVRTRVNAHYNEKEARFYPPYHTVKFVAQEKDDDTFVRYVADKKNISLASSRYFSDKFISKLREEAQKGKYLFSDLGLFYTEQDQLVFKPNEKIPTDPTFYGYPQIDINKSGQPLLGEPAKPVVDKPVSTPVAVVPPPVQTIPEQGQYFEEEETEYKRPVNVWLIMLLSIAAIALALFGVYEFSPHAFDNIIGGHHKIKKATVVPVKKQEIKVDTVQKAAPVITVVDTAKLEHFEIIAGKFKSWRKERADAAVAHYKSLGLDAKISTDAPGPLLKISVGTYFTQKEADSIRLALINSGKIKRNSDEPLVIKPKQ
jgi:hypothetical protein